MAISVRQKIKDMEGAAHISTAQKTSVDSMISYYDRQEDFQQILDSIKRQYGTGIKINEGPDGTKYETYERQDFTIQVNAGIIEAITIGFAEKVVGSLSTLFTEKGLKYSIVHPSVKDTLEQEKVLSEIRQRGGYSAAASKWDSRSVQTGSAGLLLSFENNAVTYQVVPPSSVTFYFGDYIDVEKNGKLERIPVDTSNIDHASVVVIRLSNTQLNEWRYLAIFGQCVAYPHGRHVAYTATADETKIPEVGEDGAYDFMMDGDIANPLSYLSVKNRELELPEYPLSVMRGGTTDADGVMPVTDSLYKSALQFDVVASHLLSVANDAAKGTIVFERSLTSANKPLPHTSSGPIVTEPGMTVKHVPHGAGEAKTAWEQIKDQMVAAGSSWFIPDYQMVSSDHTLDASSGVALAIKTAPLKKKRNKRVEENRPAVRRVFEIESGLISLFYEGDESFSKFLLESHQEWDAGELILPENKKELVERVNAKLEKGEIDTIEAIRQIEGFVTDEEAIAFYEKMKARKGQYPPLEGEKNKPGQRNGPLLKRRDRGVNTVG